MHDSLSHTLFLSPLTLTTPKKHFFLWQTTIRALLSRQSLLHTIDESVTQKPFPGSREENLQALSILFSYMGDDVTAVLGGMGQWSAFECLTTLWRSFVFGVDEGKDMLGRRSFQGVLRVKTPPAHRLTCPETNTETFPPALESILPTCNDKLSYAPSFFFPSVDLMSVQPKPQAINSNLVAKPTADTTAPSNAQESVLMDTKPSAYPSPPMAPLATATSGTAASTAAYFNSTTLQVAMEPTPCAPFGESPTSAEAEAVQAEASPLGQSHIPFEAPHTIVTTSHTQEVQNESVIPSLTGVAGSTILSEPVTSVAFTNITSIVRKTSTVQLTQDRQPCLNAIAAGSSAISGSQEKVTKKRKCSASSTDTPTGFQRSQTSVRAATIASSDAYTHEEKVIKKSKCSASSIEGQPSSQACQAHVCATVVASTPVDSEEVVIKKESSTSAETQSSSQSRRAIVGSRKLSIKKEPITFTETPTTDFKPIIDTGSSNTVSARRPARSTPSKERSRATLWLPTKKAPYTLPDVRSRVKPSATFKEEVKVSAAGTPGKADLARLITKGGVNVKSYIASRRCESSFSEVNIGDKVMSSTPVSAITDRQATASQSGRKDSPTLSRMQSACVLSTILTPKSPPRGDKSATIATVSQTPVESGKHLTPSMRQIASSAVSKTLNMHPTTVTPQKTGRATTSIDTTSGGSSVGKTQSTFSSPATRGASSNAANLIGVAQPVVKSRQGSIDFVKRQHISPSRITSRTLGAFPSFCSTAERESGDTDRVAPTTVSMGTQTPPAFLQEFVFADAATSQPARLSSFSDRRDSLTSKYTITPNTVDGVKGHSTVSTKSTHSVGTSTPPLSIPSAKDTPAQPRLPKPPQSCHPISCSAVPRSAKILATSRWVATQYNHFQDSLLAPL